MQKVFKNKAQRCSTPLNKNISSIFPQFPIVSLISSNFLHFLPHSGLLPIQEGPCYATAIDIMVTDTSRYWLSDPLRIADVPLLCKRTFKGEYVFGGAKNKYFKLKLKKKLPLYCFLFDNNRSFRSKIMVENVTSRIEISYSISYVFYCFFKLRYLTFSALKLRISKSNLAFDL